MKSPFYSIRSLYRNLFRRETGQESINAILNSEPIWVDLGDSWNVFRSIPHINLVLDRKASLVSQAEISVVDAEGNIDDSEFSRQALKLINKPNPLQSKNEFLYQYSVNKNLMGSSFLNPLRGTGLSEIPTNLWVIPSDAVKIETTGKLYNQTDISDIINYYELITNGVTERRFETDEIIFKNQGNTSDVILGEKPLESLRKAISNIAFAMGYVNVVYSKKGAIGILSGGASKDGSGSIPLSPKEREKITDQYINDYGIGADQHSIIVTNANMNWSPMSYPLKDLMIPEEIEQDFGIICDRFGVKRDVFSSSKGATYENQKESEIATIQGSVTQEIDDLMDSLSNNFNLVERGLKFKASFDHMPIMQKDRKDKEEADKLETDNLSQRWMNGEITRNDMRRYRGEEEISSPEMNMYIWELTSNNNSDGQF